MAPTQPDPIDHLTHDNPMDPNSLLKEMNGQPILPNSAVDEINDEATNTPLPRSPPQETNDQHETTTRDKPNKEYNNAETKKPFHMESFLQEMDDLLGLTKKDSSDNNKNGVEAKALLS